MDRQGCLSYFLFTSPKGTNSFLHGGPGWNGLPWKIVRDRVRALKNKVYLIYR